MSKTENDNCLHGFKCPKCASLEPVLSQDELLSIIYNTLNTWANEEETLNETKDGTQRFEEMVSEISSRMYEMQFRRNEPQEDSAQTYCITESTDREGNTFYVAQVWDSAQSEIHNDSSYDKEGLESHIVEQFPFAKEI